ncbi:hypothetical protein [Desulforapulum autotrophicum]|nr:hypothetical protein [Desulforapulum autotrophicum]
MCEMVMGLYVKQIPFRCRNGLGVPVKVLDKGLFNVFSLVTISRMLAMI